MTEMNEDGDVMPVSAPPLVPRYRRPPTPPKTIRIPRVQGWVFIYLGDDDPGDDDPDQDPTA